MKKADSLGVNVGCGRSPTPGWFNFDNSMAVRLAQAPWLISLCTRIGLIGAETEKFARAALEHGVRFARASELPLPDQSVDVVYSSHMFEHLSRSESRAFLAEALRVLRPLGWIRLAVPDLRRLAEQYVENRDGDAFVDSTYLGATELSGLLSRMRLLLVGHRHHLWMYDVDSLVRVLTNAGFVNVGPVEAGETRLPNQDALDLREREDESIYVEGQKPT